MASLTQQHLVGRPKRRQRLDHFRIAFSKYSILTQLTFCDPKKMNLRYVIFFNNLFGLNP